MNNNKKNNVTLNENGVFREFLKLRLSDEGQRVAIIYGFPGSGKTTFLARHNDGIDTDEYRRHGSRGGYA